MKNTSTSLTGRVRRSGKAWIIRFRNYQDRIWMSCQNPLDCSSVKIRSNFDWIDFFSLRRLHCFVKRSSILSLLHKNFLKSRERFVALWRDKLCIDCWNGGQMDLFKERKCLLLETELLFFDSANSHIVGHPWPFWMKGRSIFIFLRWQNVENHIFLILLCSSLSLAKLIA